jgi:hypothetical protein
MRHDVKTAFVTELHYLPNGGVAILDENDKLVAYNKTMLENDGKFDWVRMDARKNVKKRA